MRGYALATQDAKVLWSAYMLIKSGPGDSETWPDYYGHTNDPRHEDEPDDQQFLVSLMDEDLLNASIDVINGKDAHKLTNSERKLFSVLASMEKVYVKNGFVEAGK